MAFSLIYLSSSCHPSTKISEAIGGLQTGSNFIELSGGTEPEEGFETSLVNYRKQGVSFLLHNYFPPPDSHFILNFADPSEHTRSFIKRAVKLCRTLEVPYYSVHAGFKKKFSMENELLTDGQGAFTKDDFKKNLDWFFTSFDGFPLAIENLYPNNNDRETCFAMTVEEITELLEFHKSLGLLLDLGHLKVSGALLGFDYVKAAEHLLSEFPERIFEIHLSENNNKLDDHLILEENSSQLAILKQYKGTIVKYKINLTIEARNYTREQLFQSYQLVKSAIGGNNKPLKSI